MEDSIDLKGSRGENVLMAATMTYSSKRLVPKALKHPEFIQKINNDSFGLCVVSSSDTEKVFTGQPGNEREDSSTLICQLRAVVA